MVYITQIHLSGGTRHEHISEVCWLNPDTGAEDRSSRETMVDWISNKKGVAKVKSHPTDVDVIVVAAHPPYLRTVANGWETDNLLSLPRY